MKYKVLIVEDDPMAQQLFALFVNSSDRFELMQAIACADLTDIYCEKEQPDLIIMDIQTSMHANGLDAADRIKSKFPEIKIIIVTSMIEKASLERAKEIGVDSFWYKEVRKEPFEQLMNQTMDGQHIFPVNSPIVTIGNITSDELTDREIEVLQELITGAPNGEIAKRLNISERTVKAHLQNIMQKTGYENRTQLAVKAQESGIVSIK